MGHKGQAKSRGVRTFVATSILKATSNYISKPSGKLSDI